MTRRSVSLSWRISVVVASLLAMGGIAGAQLGPGSPAASSAGSSPTSPSYSSTTNGALENGNLAAILARTPPLTPAGQAPVADPNNAAYSSAGSTFATGATVTAGRAIYLNCSASGSVTMTLSGGGSLAYPVTAGANVLPFAVTSVSADTASCTHQNVN